METGTCFIVLPIWKRGFPYGNGDLQGMHQTPFPYCDRRMETGICFIVLPVWKRGFPYRNRDLQGMRLSPFPYGDRRMETGSFSLDSPYGNGNSHMETGIPPPQRGTAMMHNTISFNNTYHQMPPPTQGPHAPPNQEWYDNFWQAGVAKSNRINIKTTLHTRPTPTQRYALAAATLLRTVNIDLDKINQWAILDSGVLV